MTHPNKKHGIYVLLGVDVASRRTSDPWRLKR